jgi:hypothetical protein
LKGNGGHAIFTFIDALFIWWKKFPIFTDVLFSSFCMLEPARKIAQHLDDLVRLPSVRSAIQIATVEVQAELLRDASLKAASRPIPLSVFGPKVPAGVKSCRLFTLRANTPFDREMHPNSTQYILSLAGSGEIRVRQSRDTWKADRLGSESDSSLEQRWHSVQAGCWHQPVATGAKSWTVLGFHSASEQELKDVHVPADQEPD